MNENNDVFTLEDEPLATVVQNMRKGSKWLSAFLENYRPPLDGERYLTDREVAELLRVSRRTLQEYRNNRVLPFILLGGKVLTPNRDCVNCWRRITANRWSNVLTFRNKMRTFVVKTNTIMLRSEFAKLLESTIIPEGIEQEDIKSRIYPISAALMSMLPQKLYRYRSCSTLNLDAFDKDLVYAVTADKFNDPYDTLVYYSLDNIQEQMRACCTEEFLEQFKQILETKDFEFPPSVIQFFGRNNLTGLKKQVISCNGINPLTLALFSVVMENILKEILLKMGDTLKVVSTIACLSESIDSVIMWSHYAQNHEGFALEYDLRFLLEQGEMNCCILPVIYDNNRFDANSFIQWYIAKSLGLDVKNIDSLSHLKMAIHKSTQWEYENEWRIIHSEKQPAAHSRATSLKIVPKAIYYGERISNIHKKTLHYIAQEKGIAEYDMYIDCGSLKYEMLYKPSQF